MTRSSAGSGRLWRRKQKGTSVWVGDWTTADGKRRRQALSSDKRVAQRVFADIIRRRDLCAAGLGIEEGFDRPLVEIVDEFLADLTARRTPAYVQRVRSLVKMLIESTHARTVRDLHPQAYLKFRQLRLRQGVANRTANMDLVTTRTMLNWAVRSGYIAFNPLQAVQTLPTGRGYEKRPRRALTDEEIGRLVAASQQIDREAADRVAAVKTIAAGTKGRAFARKERKRAVPQTPMWIMLLETGARFSEAAQATWGDFSEARGTLTLRAKTTKSRKERVLPIRGQLAEVLVELRLIHHEIRGRIPTAGDYILLTPKGAPWVHNRRSALRRFRAVLEAAGIPYVDERGEKVDIHALRHSFASRLARSGVGLVQAQKLLGHSDPKLTAAIYTHLDTEDLRDAVESLPSLFIAQG